MISRLFGGIASVSGNIGYSLLNQAVNYLLPFVSVAILARSLGLEFYGQFSLFIVFVQFGVVLLGFGLDVSGVSFLAAHKEISVKAMRFVGASLQLKAIWIFVAIFLVTSVVAISDFTSVINGLVLWGCVAVFFQVFTLSWVFQGWEAFKYVLLINLCSKLAFVIFVYLFVSTPEDLVFTAFLYAVSQLLSFVLFCFFIYSYGCGIRFVSMRGLVVFWRSGVGFYLSRLTLAIQWPVILGLIGYFSGAGSAALFSIAERLYKAVQGMYLPFNMVLFPYFVRTGDVALLFRVSLVLLCVGAVALPVLTMMSEFLVVFVAGDEFMASSGMFEVLLFAALANLMSVMFGYPLFGAIKRISVANNTAILCGLVCISLLFVGAISGEISPLFAAYAVLISEVFILVVRVLIYVFVINFRRACV